MRIQVKHMVLENQYRKLCDSPFDSQILFLLLLRTAHDSRRELEYVTTVIPRSKAKQSGHVTHPKQSGHGAALSRILLRTNACNFRTVGHDVFNYNLVHIIFINVHTAKVARDVNAIRTPLF